MNRHYYISDNLDELERLEAELEASGIATEQIHVLSEKDAETGQRHLHEVSPFMKKDVVRSGRVGLLVGLVLAIVAVAFAYASGWTETAAGWIPVIFLGAVLCAFCLWEGSFFGLQRTNRAFRPFEERLHQAAPVLRRCEERPGADPGQRGQPPPAPAGRRHRPRGLFAAAGLAATLAAVPADGLSGGACAPRRSCAVPPAARISGYPPAIPAGAARQETP